MEDIFAKLYDMTAFSNIIADPSFLIMYAIAFILLYLGIRKHYEPLLLVPIAFGVLIANFPGGDMGVIQADENGMVMVNGVLKNIWEMPLHEIAHDLGLMNFIYYMLIKTGFLPPVIFVKLLCSKKELMINMKEQEKLYPSKTEIKNLRVLKIIFPIAVTTIVALFVPTAVPLIGMLMFGNLIKEIGSDTSRLFDAAANSIMNAATIFLGLSVGATMTSEAFLNWTTIGIVVGGFLAFALSISGGIFFVKLFNLFSKKKINPLIGATGLSAVPMASRVCNEIATKYDPKNHVLNYCMSSNISGVIGSAVAAGVLISFLG